MGNTSGLITMPSLFSLGLMDIENERKVSMMGWMVKSIERCRLADAYTFPGFRPLQRVQGMFRDSSARLVILVRRGKKLSVAPAARRIAAGTIGGDDRYGTCPVPITRIYLDLEVRRVDCRQCGAVKRGLDFAEMIERHWDGHAAYCQPENKFSLGFVEGLNNKLRVMQRRAYGLRDEEYPRLKVLTSTLPQI
jgi:hypothetical protein